MVIYGCVESTSKKKRVYIIFGRADVWDCFHMNFFSYVWVEVLQYYDKKKRHGGVNRRNGKVGDSGSAAKVNGMVLGCAGIGTKRKYGCPVTVYPWG